MLPCAASPSASVCCFHLFPRMRAQVTGAHVLHTHGVSINIDMFIYITHTHTYTHMNTNAQGVSIAPLHKHSIDSHQHGMARPISLPAPKPFRTPSTVQQDTRYSPAGSATCNRHAVTASDTAVTAHTISVLTPLLYKKSRVCVHLREREHVSATLRVRVSVTLGVRLSPRCTHTTHATASATLSFYIPLLGLLLHACMRMRIDVRCRCAESKARSRR